MYYEVNNIPIVLKLNCENFEYYKKMYNSLLISHLVQYKMLNNQTK